MPEGPEDGHQVWSHPSGLDNGCHVDVYVSPWGVIRWSGYVSPSGGNGGLSGGLEYDTKLENSNGSSSQAS